jgi:lipoyl(octanoyl) transferase
MAIDQAIADLYPSLHMPTLRFYQWQPACLSIGVAQRLHRDVNLETCQAEGIDIVRRLTGGRAILHQDEVTYSPGHIGRSSPGRNTHHC